MKPARTLVERWIVWSNEAISRHLAIGELRKAIQHAKQKRQFQKMLEESN